MVNLLAAAALAAAVPAAGPAQPMSEPAMFVVRDADTTIYLFGTFHALDGNEQWFGGSIRNAFENSNELVLETLLPEGRNAAQQLRQAQPTSRPSGSFLATTRIAISASREQGMQVENGADTVLRHVAESEGKPVEQLETLQFQLNMFSKLPAGGSPPHNARAGQPIQQEAVENLPQTMARMQWAWKHGDQAVFVRMLDQLDESSPDTYRMMFTERNARWADWIAARMQTPGTVFVAVGAGHLAGKDSVLVRLAEKGIDSQRVY